MNAPFLQAGFVRAAISKLFAEYPELAEDESLRADVLEGETDLHKVIDKALAERMDAVAMAGAIKAQEGDLETRRKRFERKADAMKSLIHGLLDAAGLTKLVLPRATLSVTQPKPVVSVLNKDELPQGYFRTERIPDKAAIKDALMRGDQIPGAELALGDEGLTIRSK